MIFAGSHEVWNAAAQQRITESCDHSRLSTRNERVSIQQIKLRISCDHPKHYEVVDHVADEQSDSDRKQTKGRFRKSLFKPERQAHTSDADVAVVNT